MGRNIPAAKHSIKQRLLHRPPGSRAISGAMCCGVLELGKRMSRFSGNFTLTEKMGLRFRGEFFNIFNHPNFGASQQQPDQPLFGRSTANASQQSGRPRQRRLQPSLSNRRPALDPAGT